MVRLRLKGKEKIAHDSRTERQSRVRPVRPYQCSRGRRTRWDQATQRTQGTGRKAFGCFHLWRMRWFGWSATIPKAYECTNVREDDGTSDSGGSRDSRDSMDLQTAGGRQLAARRLTQMNSRTTERFSENAVLVCQSYSEPVLVEILGGVGRIANGENVGKI